MIFSVLKEGWLLSGYKKTDKYISMNMMERDGQHISYTPKGFLVSNAILGDLLS